jgi:CelD/BcsL family acetyltransferase involved in cellulose biosynthesis
MAMALTVRVVDDVAELERSRAPWEALLARSAASSPMCSPTWLLAWWRVFGADGGRALRALLVCDGPRLVGLAPLLARRVRSAVGVPIRRIELLGSGEDEADEICSEYIGIVAARGDESAVADALAVALTGKTFEPWDELALCAMNGDSPFPFALAAALRARGCVARLEVTGTAHYIPLPASWDEYLAALPSSHRYLVRRSTRDLESWAGSSLSVHRATTTEDLPGAMAILEKLHTERWFAEGKGGVFDSARFRAFHSAVAPELLARGALDVTWLSANGEPIAASYDLIWDGKVQYYQGGRSLRVPRGVRPGIVLHARRIRDAIAAGVREYDFLAGNARYKRDLALAARPLVELVATPPSLFAAARHATALARDQVRALRARIHADFDG